MTKNEIKTALIAAGHNEWLLIDREWQEWQGQEAIHVSFYDLDTLPAGKVSAIMAKCDNPTSGPQCRPIEQFWNLSRKEMIKLGLVSHDISLFKRRWNSVSKKIDMEHGKNLEKHYF